MKVTEFTFDECRETETVGHCIQSLYGDTRVQCSVRINCLSLFVLERGR